jgi:GR25 family glycosyltransferase involved in LPS biosynthesis
VTVLQMSPAANKMHHMKQNMTNNRNETQTIRMHLRHRAPTSSALRTASTYRP